MLSKKYSEGPGCAIVPFRAREGHVKKDQIPFQVSIATFLVILVGILACRSFGSKSTTSTPPDQPKNHKLELQTFAWNQFQLFITGGERHDGTYDNAWGPWSQWITRSDLNPHPLNSAATAVTSLSANQFKQLVFSGMSAAVHENSASDRKLTPTKCNPDTPAPCSTVLYNARAQSHIDSASILSLAAVAKFPKGENGGIDRFPDDSIIAKTAWAVVHPLVGHQGLGSLVFSDPDFPHVQQFYVLLDPGQPCRETQTLPVVTGHVGSINQVALACFISVQVKTKAEAQAISQGVSPVRQGAYVLLLGLNVVRKQQGRWIWSAIWWTPDQQAQPEYDRKPKDLQSPQWSHYRANATNSMFDPDNPKKRLICYNPYLEQSVSNESVSNCVICHRLAEYPIPGNAFTLGSPAAGQSTDVTPGYYSKSVRTDSLWTIADILQEASHSTLSHSPPGSAR